MRYCVFSKTLSLNEVVDEVSKAGAANVTPARTIRQVFCELTPSQHETLTKVPSIVTKEVRSVRTAQMLAPVVEYTAAQEGLNLSSLFNDFRAAFTPPLSGVGLTVAVLDSGIRDTHETLLGKVIYEHNFTDSATAGDIFGHGTNISYIIAGGIQGDVNSGIAPGAKLINLKVLADDGEGFDEWVIEAIDEVCALVEEAILAGKEPSDPTYPNVINLSLGAPDDGDPDNPVRVACRVAVEEYGLQVIAAGGNEGDLAGTILLPACEPEVVAVGGIESLIFEIWGYSSRGPTEEGHVKPDFVVWATNIYVADVVSDNGYTYKTGTSFSAPILSGIIGLVWELGRRNFGESWSVSWYDVEGVGEAVCMKPEGAPIYKDNAWGYGLPALRPLMSGAQPVVPVMDITSIMSLMLMMLPMSMMGGMAAG